MEITNIVEIEEQIKKKLRKVNLTRVVMIRSEGGNLILDQINNSLIFISPSQSYLYELEYIQNYHGGERIGDQNTVLYCGYVMKIKKTIDRHFNQAEFYNMISQTRKPIQHRGWSVLINGKPYKYNVTKMEAHHVYTNIKESGLAPAELRPLKVLSVTLIDQSGKRTRYELKTKRHE